MTRGSRVERSAEERERARQERARRRAEREGAPLPPLEEPAPAPEQTAPAEQPSAADVDEATQQWDVLAETEPPNEVERFDAQPAPAAHEPEHAQYVTQPVVAHEPEPYEHGSEPVAHESEPPGFGSQPVAHESEPSGYSSEPVAHEAEPSGYSSEPVAHEAEPSGYASEPLTHDPEPSPYVSEPLAHDPEHSQYASVPPAHDPEPAPYASEPPAHDPQPAPYASEPPAHDPEPAPYASVPPAHDPQPASYASEPPGHDPQPPEYPSEPLEHEPAEAPFHDPSADELAGAAPSTEELAAAELSAEQPPPEAAEPPPPRSPSPKRGARRKAAAGGDGGRLPPLPPAARAPLEPRRRSSSTRVAAVAALVLVVVAAIVVLVASGSSSNSKTSSTATPTLLNVVVPEGQTRLQIARTAAHVGLTGSYRTASKHSQLLDPTSYGAPAGTPDLEGFLFPATYDLHPGAPAARLVEDQLIAFKENFGAKQIARARALNITPYQLLIVASMVEREAQVPSDRPKIAAVIYNRLHAGMPLGIDATLYYAIEMRRNIPTYTAELTESDLHMSSLYNTRTHVGLPPTPIANPGMASIEAAGEPAHASYLYYVLGADGCGEHVFSTSEAQFQINAAAYQAAVRKNGGHPPACKKR